MKKKVFIFDFDGTIADSVQLEHDSLINTLHQYGHPEINDDNIENYYNPTEKGILLSILKDKMTEKIWKNYLEEYDRLQPKTLKKQDGIEDILIDLTSNKDNTVFLVTGRSEETLLSSLKYLNIAKYFKTYYYGSLYGCDKDIKILQAQKDLNFNIADAVYIGDTITDVKTMRRINLDIISYVKYKSNDEINKIEESNHYHICHTINELKEVLKEI